MRHGHAFGLSVVLSLSAPHTAMAIDLAPLWDFAQPALSEQRFRAALATAQGDDVLILQTQIARSLGLRSKFDGARALLREIEPKLATAGPEARVRWQLEWGRSHASAAHPKDTVTPAQRVLAREAYQAALDTARDARLDGLAIDAIHMFAFTDEGPVAGERWAREALALAAGSTQPAARRWEPSIRNNLGMALHGQGRYGEALVEFRQALALREQRGDDAQALGVARWMVAWTLRALGRVDEALAIQQQLERDTAAAGRPDVYVFEELEALHRARGEAVLAQAYADRVKAARRVAGGTP